MNVTQAKKKRAEVEQARDYYRKDQDTSGGKNTSDCIAKLKQKLPCAKCGALGHWAKECPQRGDGKKVNMLGWIGFQALELRMAARKQNPMKVLIDTACAKSVMGEPFAREYTKFMADQYGHDVVRVAEKEPFRFGPTRTVYSACAITMIISVGEHFALIRVSVINKDSPCSITVTQQAGTQGIEGCRRPQCYMVIRFAEFGAKVKLPLVDTITGHVAMPITDFERIPPIPPSMVKAVRDSAKEVSAYHGPCTHPPCPRRPCCIHPPCPRRPCCLHPLHPRIPSYMPILMFHDCLRIPLITKQIRSVRSTGTSPGLTRLLT